MHKLGLQALMYLSYTFAIIFMIVMFMFFYFIFVDKNFLGLPRYSTAFGSLLGGFTLAVLSAMAGDFFKEKLKKL